MFTYSLYKCFHTFSLLLSQKLHFCNKLKWTMSCYMLQIFYSYLPILFMVSSSFLFVIGLCLLKSLVKWNGWLPEKHIRNRTFCTILKDCLSAVQCQTRRTFPVSTREVCLDVVLLNSFVNDFDLSLEVICKIYGWLPASQVLKNRMKIQNVCVKLERWFDINKNKVVQTKAKCFT